jgi:hypothetical protein
LSTSFEVSENLVRKTLNDRFEIVNPWMQRLADKRATFFRYMTEVYGEVMEEAATLSKAYELGGTEEGEMFASILPGKFEKMGSVRGTFRSTKNLSEQMAKSEVIERQVNGSIGSKKGKAVDFKKQKNPQTQEEMIDSEEESPTKEPVYEALGSPVNDTRNGGPEGRPSQSGGFTGFASTWKANSVSTPTQQKGAQGSMTFSTDIPKPNGESNKGKLGNLWSQKKIATENAKEKMNDPNFLNIEGAQNEKVSFGSPNAFPSGNQTTFPDDKPGEWGRSNNPFESDSTQSPFTPPVQPQQSQQPPPNQSNGLWSRFKSTLAK